MVLTVAVVEVVGEDFKVAPVAEYVPPVYNPQPEELPTKLPPL